MSYSNCRSPLHTQVTCSDIDTPSTVQTITPPTTDMTPNTNHSILHSSKILTSGVITSKDLQAQANRQKPTKQLNTPTHQHNNTLTQQHTSTPALAYNRIIVSHALSQSFTNRHANWNSPPGCISGLMFPLTIPPDHYIS